MRKMKMTVVMVIIELLCLDNQWNDEERNRWKPRARLYDAKARTHPDRFCHLVRLRFFEGSSANYRARSALIQLRRRLGGPVERGRSRSTTLAGRLVMAMWLSPAVMERPKSLPATARLRAAPVRPHSPAQLQPRAAWLCEEASCFVCPEWPTCIGLFWAWSAIPARCLGQGPTRRAVPETTAIHGASSATNRL